MFDDLNSSSYSIKVIFEKNMREIYSKEELKKLKPNQYKRLLGVDFAIVCKMETIVEKSYREKHKKGGRKNKFTAHEMVILFLLYVKNYNAMEDYAFNFKVSKSTICTTIHFVLNSLIKDKNFTLFGSLYTKSDSSEDRQIDVTEVRIERPKYQQKEKYSGKKKYHTMKIQIIRGVETGFIYEIEIGPGAEHDFHLWKRTFKGTPQNVTNEVDLGYLGMDKYHKKSRIPHKNSKYHKLTEEEIKENKELAKDRIFIEHTNGWIKRFKILSTKFRNHLFYFAKFAMILCGFYNFDRA